METNQLGPDGYGVRLGPVYLESEAIERARFLDQAALAALPVMLEKWEKTLMDGDSDMTMANVDEFAAQDAFASADALLAWRDRRRSEAKAGSPFGDAKK